MIRSLSLASFAILLMASAVIAQEKQAGPVIFSDNYGSRTQIGYSDLALVAGVTDPVDELDAIELEPAGAARLFLAACVTSGFRTADYRAALAAGPLNFGDVIHEFQPMDIPKPLLGVNRVPGTFRVQQQARGALASLWSTEDRTALEFRPTVIFSGRLVITGPYREKNFLGPQCNLTLKLSGWTTATALFDAVAAGVPTYKAARRVEKPKYALLKLVNATSQLVVDVERLGTDAATVHMTFQTKPAAVRRP